jgi:diacylglycerol kinase family enzyme
MYLYLYDSFLIDQKYRKLIDRIETRLTDLGINGKMVRLTILKNAGEVIKDYLRQGVQTVVAVGGDHLLSESAIAAAGTEAALGFIPVGESSLAEILGVPQDVYACDTISGRRLKTIDLGKINDQYFLSSVQIDSPDVTLKCNGSYQIAPISVQAIKIINLDWLNFVLPKAAIEIQKEVSSPQDGLLEILLIKKSQVTLPFLKKTAKKDSLFYVKKLYVEAKGEKGAPLIVDGERIFKTPALIEVKPKCLKIIVGRDRMI